jgi:mRNA-degrading endonuclease RelE of RelBE toxin-antitoxin system
MAASRRGGRRKAGAKPSAAAPASSHSGDPWKIRYAKLILTLDLREVGHAALANARKAIEKKLSIDPHQYGDGLRPPLDGIHKLKSSHVRVACHIEEADHEVWVLMIGDRSVMWDRHEDDILRRLVIMREEKLEREAAKRPEKDTNKGR